MAIKYVSTAGSGQHAGSVVAVKYASTACSGQTAWSAVAEQYAVIRERDGVQQPMRQAGLIYIAWYNSMLKLSLKRLSLHLLPSSNRTNDVIGHTWNDAKFKNDDSAIDGTSHGKGKGKDKVVSPAPFFFVPFAVFYFLRVPFFCFCVLEPKPKPYSHPQTKQ